MTRTIVRFSEHIAIRPLAGPTLAFLPYSSRSTKESQIENAALIVKAVNSYEAMRESLETMHDVLSDILEDPNAELTTQRYAAIQAIDKSAKAISLAEGKEPS